MSAKKLGIDEDQTMLTSEDHQKARECLQVLTISDDENKRAAAVEFLITYIHLAENQTRELGDTQARLTRANRDTRSITGRRY